MARTGEHNQLALEVQSLLGASVERAASAKDQAENQLRGKRNICLNLLLISRFQENLITSLHLSTKEEILTSHIQQIIDRVSV